MVISAKLVSVYASTTRGEVDQRLFLIHLFSADLSPVMNRWDPDPRAVGAGGWGWGGSVLLYVHRNYKDYRGREGGRQTIGVPNAILSPPK